MTTAISIKEFRAKTDEIVDSVIALEETIIVTLADGRKFALVPDTKFNVFDETAYLLSTPANRAALALSLKEAASGKTVKIDL